MAKIKHVTETDDRGIKSELFIITDTWTSYQDDPLLIGDSLTVAYVEEYDIWGGSKVDEMGDEWELDEDEVNKLRIMYSIDEKVLKLGYKPGYLEPSSKPLQSFRDTGDSQSIIRELNLNSICTQYFAFTQLQELFHYSKNIPDLFQWNIFDALDEVD